MDDRDQPRTIDVKKDQGVTITFEDGDVVSLDLLTLRQGCPCAGCRGDRDQGRDPWPKPGAPTPLLLVGAELHGAWALAFTWNDGHTAGVYPFTSLRRWAAGDPAFPPDSGLGGATA